MDAIFFRVFYDLQFSAADSRLLKNVYFFALEYFLLPPLKQKLIKNKVISLTVQTIGRCHASLLRNAKTFVFLVEHDKGYFGILMHFIL